MKINFAKYSGCGNDFILIDNRSYKINPSKKIIANLCHRHHGIGADGLIFLEDSKKADCRMRIFNADGSEAEMCGNGIRCLANYMNAINPKNNILTLETMHQLMRAEVKDSVVKISIPTPKDPICFQEVLLDKPISVYLLDSGVPHAVIFVDELKDEDLILIAPKIRFHSLFQPEGVNVSFAKSVDEKTLKIRTYERGVEGETLACGTAAIATALISSFIKKTASPTEIETKSGDSLVITFEKEGDSFLNVIMQGPAVKVFEGSFEFS